MADFDSRGGLPRADRFTEYGHDTRGVITAAAPVVPDTTDPIVTLVSPLPVNGALPIETDTAIVVDVTEESTDGLCVVFIWAVIPTTGDAEVIHDGTSFSTRYIGLSARSPITGGFRYTIRRSGGWPASPRLRVKAVDRAGNEAS